MAIHDPCLVPTDNAEIAAKSVKRLVITGNKWLPGAVRVHTEACTDVTNEEKIKQ